MPDVLLIVNPCAARVTSSLTTAIEDILSVQATVRTRLTEFRDHATALCLEATGVDAIVVFSGDGVFNEALNGLPRDVPIGLVPGGQTNVLPRALGLPRDPLQAARACADAIANHSGRSISLGRVNGRRFAFAAGLGLDAELVRRVDRIRWGRGGRAPGAHVFIAEALKLVVERRGKLDASLQIDGFGRAAFAIIANCDPYTYLGRLAVHVAPLAEFDGGLDLVAVRELRPRMIPKLLAYLLFSHGQTRDRAIAYGHDLDNIRITCEVPTPIQVDGEDLGNVREANISCERNAATFLIPTSSDQLSLSICRNDSDDWDQVQRDESADM